MTSTPQWCAPCRKLEEVAFHDASAVKRAVSDFVMVKVDVTRGGNPVHDKLPREYAVKCVPTVVFLETSGGGEPICVWWIAFRPIGSWVAWRK